MYEVLVHLYAITTFELIKKSRSKLLLPHTHEYEYQYTHEYEYQYTQYLET